ncbi:MAG: ribosome-recycling factor [Candidatus Pacebacteria bacterium]|nr:ribosome-recycling factor [Candidatus Paceibacterota bacterium]
MKAYGGLSPINQLASIGIEDSQTLLVTPFDSSIIREFEKAIQDSKLDLNMSVSGNSIRISFPNLTSDRKKMLIKLAKERLEESRVRLRKYRDDTKNKIEEKHKNSEINEDMKFSLKEEMEKITKEANNELEKMFQKKEEEIFS